MQDVEVGKFHAQAAQKGYALNQMCYSLNKAENRKAYAKDPAAYCAAYGLNAEEQAAALSRDKTLLLNAGGNMYFFAKLDRALRAGPGKG
ncbi:hypothetical protein EOE18_17535 [Novosphingobium umbonatum]|uniref:Extradiol ring-cleavage dioxygenase LigAB LigA subunit domain-containing protein n=1 Tax=Novosphingobium umbonatum TaxID=1908524 RepID=A0A437MX98_9SPHN|nr:hypothetical protein [Novosphingobium umbonatum]RVU02267.1 hypothetical protein EOE18_17535 [Novosphingobium umbonatum]